MEEVDKKVIFSFLEDVNGGFLIFTKDLDYFKSLEGIEFFNLVECGRGTLEEVENAFGKFSHIYIKSNLALYEIKSINKGVRQFWLGGIKVKKDKRVLSYYILSYIGGLTDFDMEKWVMMMW